MNPYITQRNLKKLGKLKLCPKMPRSTLLILNKSPQGIFQAFEFQYYRMILTVRFKQYCI
jgi:hypothetical protein